ncbi:hypothetical protein C8Q75DRAFT_364277 [Abortiporus biennis]|nr:hypothetical protein C8Q75DRAFT_364277 [Abortiporus biennis]
MLAMNFVTLNAYAMSQIGRLPSLIHLHLRNCQIVTDESGQPVKVPRLPQLKSLTMDMVIGISLINPSIIVPISDKVAWWKPFLDFGTVTFLALTEIKYFSRQDGVERLLFPSPESNPRLPLSFRMVRKLVINDHIAEHPEYIRILHFFSGVEEFSLQLGLEDFFPRQKESSPIPDHILPRLNTVDIPDRWLTAYLGSGSTCRQIRHVRFANTLRDTRIAADALRDLATLYSGVDVPLETLYISIGNFHRSDDPIPVLDPIFNGLPDLKVAYIRCPLPSRSIFGVVCRALADKQLFHSLCPVREQTLERLVIGQTYDFTLISNMLGTNTLKSTNMRFDHVIRSVREHCPNLQEFSVFGDSSYLIWPEYYRAWKDRSPLWCTSHLRRLWHWERY